MQIYSADAQVLSIVEYGAEINSMKLILKDLSLLWATCGKLWIVQKLAGCRVSGCETNQE
jgi:hypothetical protein